MKTNKNVLENLQSPKDIKNLSLKECKILSSELREFIINKSNDVELHLSSNLGIIELTIALLNQFDPSNDKILFDTGHQTYAYRILTGMKEEFKEFKKSNKMSSLMNMKESQYNHYSPGHSGNILSVASGMYQKYHKNNINKKNGSYLNKNNIVAIVGDSAFSNGLSFEALNDISFKKEPIIIILNDNGMSISKSVGALATMVNNIKSLKSFHFCEKMIAKIFNYGKTYDALYKFFNWFQWRIIGKNLFENLGFKYIGPINGHDIKKLKEVFNQARFFARKGPVIVHVKTQKGLGHKKAELDICGEYHSTTKQKNMSYGMHATNKMISLMKKHKNIMVLNPAMTHASNCEKINNLFPNRYFDVGIAEEHAISKASGMSLNGLIPYIYLYSTFSQRGYDQFLHDIARLNLRCNLLIDRADISCWDGPTHHGIFDVSMLKTIPNTIISMPRNINQLNQLIDLSYTNNKNKIFAIRYLRNDTNKIPLNHNYKIQWLKWEHFKQPNKKAKTVIISYGPYINNIYEKFFEKYNVDIVNAIFIHGYDKKQLHEIVQNYQNIIVYERIYGDKGLLADINQIIVSQSLIRNVIGMHYKNIIEFGPLDQLEKKEKMHLNDLEKVLKKLN